MNKIIAFKSETDKTDDCYRLTDGQWEKQKLSVPEEMPLRIIINGNELVTILCSPSDLNFLVTGYLFSEGIIKNVEDIENLKVYSVGKFAEVKLKNNVYAYPQKKVLTSGFGGGISLGREKSEINLCSRMKTCPETIFKLIQLMIDSGTGYRLTGGIHTTALCDSETILTMGEDIGRHNTLDKVIGKCLIESIQTKDKIMMTTGRIASEILKKAVTLEVPIIASLSSPTSEAVSLARKLGVTLIGYVRGRNMIVYSNPQRLKADKAVKKFCIAEK